MEILYGSADIQDNSARIEEVVSLLNRENYIDGDMRLSEIPITENDIRLSNRVDFLKGYIAYKEKRYEDALNIFNTLSKRYPMIAEYILYYTALVYEDSGKITDSIAILENIKKRFRSSPLRACLKS